MAQEAPAVQNKWLLVVAGLLGLIVAVIYNVHVSMVRHSLEGNNVTLLRVTRDMKAGDRIKPADIERFDMPRQYSGSLENVVPGDEKNYNWVMDQTLSQDVAKGENLRWAHVTEGGSSGQAASHVTPGMRSFTFQISPNETPGQLVQVGGHVDVYGVFAVGNKPPSTYQVLHGATVLTIEGRASREKIVGTDRRTVTEESFPSFRTISIEVPQDVFLQMNNLQTHLVDGKPFKVSALNPKDEVPKAPSIANEALKSLAASAAPSGRGMAGNN